MHSAFVKLASGHSLAKAVCKTRGSVPVATILFRFFLGHLKNHAGMIQIMTRRTIQLVRQVSPAMRVTQSVKSARQMVRSAATPIMSSLNLRNIPLHKRIIRSCAGSIINSFALAQNCTSELFSSPKFIAARSSVGRAIKFFFQKMSTIIAGFEVRIITTHFG